MKKSLFLNFNLFVVLCLALCAPAALADSGPAATASVKAEPAAATASVKAEPAAAAATVKAEPAPAAAVKAEPPAAAGEKADNFPKVRPGDTLDIQVYQEENLSGEFAVSEAGTIQFGLLGAVRVDGMTTDELQAHLRTRLEQNFLVNPQVQVRFVERSNLSVTIQVSILGQISSPGNYDFKKGTTLVRLIAQAGGFRAGAAQNRVRLVRSGPTKGKQQVMMLNAAAIIAGNAQDVVLQKGDIITVEESYF